MEYQEVVMGRRSIRGFLDKPVSKQMVNEVLSLSLIHISEPTRPY